jgi:hypothetical protein
MVLFMTKPKAIICDLDGTLANHEHRLHYVQVYEKRWEDEEKYYGPLHKGQSGYISFNKDGSLFEGKNWPAFFEAMDKDTPNGWCVKIINSLIEEYGITPIYLTGRPEIYKYITVKQITGWVDPGEYSLFMKPDANCKDGEDAWKSAAQFKREVYHQQIKDKYDVLFVLEDDELCTRMYREQGLTVLQCK